MTKHCLILALVALAATSLAAGPSLDRRASDKPLTTTTPPPADPAMLRQGGNTIADAVVIDAIPYSTTGTTAGYTHDYDEACPFPNSSSPDVVYSYTPPADTVLDFDLFGSTYDTKIYIYDENLNLVACNDDYYPDFVSLLEYVGMNAGVTYYLVIDGFGGESGDYVLNVDPSEEPCDLAIPPGATSEGEPPLAADYVDCHNSGCQHGDCDGQDTEIFQELVGDDLGELVFHGRGGWYPIGLAEERDQDHLALTMGPTGMIEITFDAQSPTYCMDLRPADCDGIQVDAFVIGGPCDPVSMTIAAEPGSAVWIVVKSTTFEAPAQFDPDGDGVAEYDYLATFTGLAMEPVATESKSFSAVRALYD